MGMFEYGIGGNAAPIEASEAMADIPMNRSIFIQKLTDTDPIKPQAVYDCKTVDEVFEHFKPKVEVEFVQKDGSTTSEQINFTNLGDFKPSNIVNQSNYLKDLSTQKEEYLKLMKQLKTNKLVKSVIENQDTNKAFVDSLKSLIQELENAK